jgi:hypothetical protein
VAHLGWHKASPCFARRIHGGCPPTICADCSASWLWRATPAGSGSFIAILLNRPQQRHGSAGAMRGLGYARRIKLDPGDYDSEPLLF